MTDKEVAGLLAKRFIARQDVIAAQTSDGNYMPLEVDGERVAWKMSHLMAHVAGTATYGHYLLNRDDECKMFAFDIDLVPGWPEPETPKVFPPVRLAGIDVDPRATWAAERREPTEEMVDVMASMYVQLYSASLDLAARIADKLGIEIGVAYSGNKGFHVYGFTGLMPAAKVRKAALLILASYGGQWEPFKGVNFYKWNGVKHSAISLEVFPKQDTLGGKDLGNLLRLPLGINRKSGQEGFFLDCTREWDDLYPADPVSVLTNGTTLR